MIRRLSTSADLPHLVAFGLMHAAVAAIRPTVSYRALELGAGAGHIGVIGGSFALLSLLAAIPIGSQIDRRGERMFFMFGAAIVVAAAAINSVAGAVVILVVTQALLGFGQLCAGLAVQTITAGGPPHLRDSRFARMAVAGSAGQFFGPPGAGAIIDSEEGLVGLGSIPTVFALAGVVTVLAAVVAWKAPGWKHGTGGRISRGRPSKAFGMVGIPGMKQALLTSIAVLTTVDILIAYLPVLGEENGIRPTFIGLVLSVQAAAGVVSRLVAGRMITRFGRRLTLSFNIGMAGLALITIALLPHPGVLLVLIAAIGFGLGVGMPITSAWVSDRAPDGQVGSALALRLAGNRLGQLLAPAGIGLLAGVAGTSIVFVAAAFGLIGSAWWMKTAPVGPATAE